MTLFSILTPSFNHQDYVGYFIESLLAQSFGDFELLIVDDCSSDENVERILAYRDSRIKLIRHEFNQGINAALNTAFMHASGEYLVFCASDDALEPHALEVFKQAWEANPNAAAIYPTLREMDINNHKSSKQVRLKHKSREEYLAHLFLKGTPLASPGMSIRREVFQHILYPLDRAMCNQQDTQMHIKLLLHGEIVRLDEAIVCYRVGGGSNISHRVEATTNRENMEIPKLLDCYLSMPSTLVQNVFAKELGELGLGYKEEHKGFILGQIALTSPILMRKMWGYWQIMESCATQKGSQELYKTYGFDFKAFLALAHKLNANLDLHYQKYKKYKKRCIISSIFALVFLLFALCLLVL